MATTGITVGTTTNTNAMVTGVIMADTHIGTRARDTGTNAIIALRLTLPTIGTGHHGITATLTIDDDTEQRRLHQTGLVLPKDQQSSGLNPPRKLDSYEPLLQKTGGRERKD
jgi:hypothetical protein